MTFDFLPNLPKANLDDRHYEDLIEECLQRIPRYCPEWTHYNPSDPGITLVELFAWLTDQTLARLNQVPRRQYIAFLELLGVRLQPPTPAQAELTFYLSSALAQRYTIPAGIEVATDRTPTETAIVFTTDQPLVIGKPQIRHLLTATRADDQPRAVRDRLVNLWSQEADGAWGGPELSLFDDRPRAGNCVYLVFDDSEPLDGNAIALTIKGQEATPTGINPHAPPRRWEAWDGDRWQPILDRETDDESQGFSFTELARQGGNPLQGVDLLLHLPVTWPAVQFVTYRGRWLRCVCLAGIGDGPTTLSPGIDAATGTVGTGTTGTRGAAGAEEAAIAPASRYVASPRLVGLSCRSVGGTVPASQCTRITKELLGVSSGEPGQTFQLKSLPVLPREPGEHLVTVDALGAPQRWQEVPDFADSGPNDLHYTLDPITGTVQFGPQIREPHALRSQTQARREAIQAAFPVAQSPPLDRWIPAQTAALPASASPERVSLERQYGAVPPRGCRVFMAAYRTGGGRHGNVQAGTIQILKTAVPYVTQAINRSPAYNGSDAETLEQAVIRVPKLLRSRDRAVTPEDFETLTLQGGRGAVARARCRPAIDQGAGGVSVLIIPQTDLAPIQQGRGINPRALTLTPALRDQVLAYLDQRRLLGVRIECGEPDYTGVMVQAELSLEAAYDHPEGREAILHRLRVALYGYFNPLTGGPEGTGWPFGRPVYVADAIALFQSFPEIRQIGAVQLFELYRQGSRWQRLPPTSVIDPGPDGTICSWADLRLQSGHLLSCY